MRTHISSEPCKQYSDLLGIRVFLSLICEKRQFSEVLTNIAFIKSQFKHVVLCLRAISTPSSVNSPYLLSIFYWIVDPFLLSLYKVFPHKNLSVWYKLQIFSHRPFLFNLSFGCSFSPCSTATPPLMVVLSALLLRSSFTSRISTHIQTVSSSREGLMLHYFLYFSTKQWLTHVWYVDCLNLQVVIFKNL